jgi:hypothetical protein
MIMITDRDRRRKTEDRRLKTEDSGTEIQETITDIDVESETERQHSDKHQNREGD